MGAGGALEVDSQYNNDFDGKITFPVIMSCIIAASSGLMFGYDLGISGGVTMMPTFLAKFFPEILKKAASAEQNMYCVYNSQILTLFTSSLYLAGLFSSLVGSRVTSSMGRRNTLMLGGAIFLVGGAINGGAQNTLMLIVGRLLLGFGIGLTNQAGPLYLSETAPTRWRGAMNTGFQFFVEFGVVAAGCINYATSKHPWGWRISLGLAMVPAALMTFGTFLINDSPSSLVDRNRIEEARKALQKLRGPHTNIEPELEELIRWSEVAKSLQQEPFKTIVERQYRPHLVIAIAIPFFQQFTGVNIVAFYAPNIFQSVGSGNDAALLSAIILGIVNLFSILVFSSVVDRVGRRLLFIIGGVQMLICQIAVAMVLAAATGADGTGHITKGKAELLLLLMCVFSAGFGLSWGPLLWLVPSEIFPLKIRTTGQSIAVAVQFLTIFITSQSFLAMLCHLKFGAFLFHAAWLVVMTIFIIVFLPETKGIQLDSIYTIWKKHWFWQRFVR